MLKQPTLALVHPGITKYVYRVWPLAIPFYPAGVIMHSNVLPPWTDLICSVEFRILLQCGKQFKNFECVYVVGMDNQRPTSSYPFWVLQLNKFGKLQGFRNLRQLLYRKIGALQLTYQFVTSFLVVLILIPDALTNWCSGQLGETMFFNI